MSARPTRLVDHLRLLLSPAQRVWWLAVWGPVALYVLVLKCWRIASLDQAVSLSTSVDFIRSELFWCLALGAFGFAGFCLARSRRMTRLVGWTFQGIAIVVAVANIVSHRFFIATGSTMDWSLLWFGLRHFFNAEKVISSEVPWATIVTLCSSVVYLLTVPPLLARRAHDTDEQAFASPTRRFRRVAAGAMAVALMSLGVAVLPATGPNESTGFVREPTLELALSALWNDTVAAAGGKTFFDTSKAHLQKSDGKPPKNVVLIFLESTRASATSVYNPDLDTTPYLKSLADSSTVMRQAYAVMPHTSKALVAMLCGIPPEPTMQLVEAASGNIPGKCLPKLLAEQGYQTVFMQAATGRFEHRKKLVSTLGFDDFFSLEDFDTTGFDRVNYFGYEDNVVLEPSRKWLQKHRGKPFLATYMTLTTHHKYRPPHRYGFHDYATDATFNRYLNAVNYLDHFVHNLIEQYKALGLYKSTIFVILGDHGEGFGEHGRYQHDDVIYQEGIHIPWLIHGATTPKGRGAIATPVSQLDLVPTVLDLLGFEVRDAQFPGTSVYDAPAGRPMFFSCWYADRCIGMIQNGYKFIYHYGDRPGELFNLGNDPDERHSIARKHPYRVEQMRRMVLTWKRLVTNAYEGGASVPSRHQDGPSGVPGDVVSRQPPDVPVRRELTYGERIRLLGYHLSRSTASPGEQVEITLYYKVLKDIKATAGVRYRIVGKGENALLPHQPLAARYPLWKWEKGQFVQDKFTMTVPQSWTAPNLRFQIEFGTIGAHRWPVRTPNASDGSPVVFSIDVK